MKTKPSKIKAALLDWLGIPISLTNEQFWSSVSLTEAGQAINDATILKLSSVWACARIISETISTLPLHVYEKTPDGRIQNDSTEVASLLKQPNSTSTSAVFWEAMLAAMLLRGNGLAEKNTLVAVLLALSFYLLINYVLLGILKAIAFIPIRKKTRLNELYQNGIYLGFQASR